MSVDKETQSFYSELNPKFQALQEAFVKEASNQEQVCLTLSKNNESSFVDCMIKKDKEITRQEKNIGYRMAYLNIYTKNCFANAKKDGKSFDNCKQTVQNLLEKYQKETIQAIKK